MRRYKCMGCGRSKFYRKWQPHWCIGGFRKHRFFEFVEVVEVTELKRCPFCGSEMFAPHFYEDMLLCTNEGCYFYSVYLPVITFDKINAKIAQLTAERDEWRKDAERLAKNHLSITKANQFICSYCGYIERKDGGTWVHQDTCPITLHRELEEKYGGEK